MWPKLPQVYLQVGFLFFFYHEWGILFSQLYGEGKPNWD